MKVRRYSMLIAAAALFAALLSLAVPRALAQEAEEAPPELPSLDPVATELSGRWIEVDTSQGVAIAVEDGEVARTALVTVGVPPWSTPTGYFTINRRVENETMNSGTIGIPLGTPGSYYLTDVLYTQYFYGGVAIHYNYWSPPEAFGSAAGSHGCVGTTLEDAEFFWEFAELGTPVVVY